MSEDDYYIKTAADAQQLRAVCPSLQHAGLAIHARWPAALAALDALACHRVGGPVTLGLGTHTWEEAGRFCNLASRTADMLSRVCVDEIHFGDITEEKHPAFRLSGLFGSEEAQISWADFEQRSSAADPAATARAAAALGAALAQPVRGPSVVQFAEHAAVPRFAAALFDALTPQSPLRTLRVFCGRQYAREALDGPDAALAAALAPGRCCLAHLELESVGSGCGAQFRQNLPPALLLRSLVQQRRAG